MKPHFHLKITTLRGTTYSGEATHALIPAEDGYVGILAHHAPYVTSSPGGIVEVDERHGRKEKFKVGPGFFTVARNEASFLTEHFEAAKVPLEA